MRLACVYQGCETTAATEPIHRLPPKGEAFQGACARHWWDLATPQQQARQRAHERSLPHGS